MHHDMITIFSCLSEGSIIMVVLVRKSTHDRQYYIFFLLCFLFRQMMNEYSSGVFSLFEDKRLTDMRKDD